MFQRKLASNTEWFASLDIHYNNSLNDEMQKENET